MSWITKRTANFLVITYRHGSFHRKCHCYYRLFIVLSCSFLSSNCKFYRFWHFVFENSNICLEKLTALWTCCLLRSLLSNEFVIRFKLNMLLSHSKVVLKSAMVNMDNVRELHENLPDGDKMVLMNWWYIDNYLLSLFQARGGGVLTYLAERGCAALMGRFFTRNP